MQSKPSIEGELETKFQTENHRTDVRDKVQSQTFVPNSVYIFVTAWTPLVRAVKKNGSPSIFGKTTKNGGFSESWKRES